jgi:hypothetical protein
MTKRLLALATGLMMTAPLLAAPGFAQTAPAPAAPAPATPAPAAAAPAAPATAVPAKPMPGMPMAPAAGAPAKPMPAHQGAMPASGDHAAMRMERMKKLQTALNANGATLTVDGRMGPKTKSALMDFQKAKGLKVTGHPDKETIAALKAGG